MPDSECFQANVRSTYNIIEAACKLGVKKILIASSETTYGVCFAQGDSDYHFFPLEENYDVDPEDTFVPPFLPLMKNGGRSCDLVRGKGE